VTNISLIVFHANLSTQTRTSVYTT